MEEYLFTFRSVTAAMQNRRSLEQAGVTCVLVRLPKMLRGQGCGYGLRVRGSLYAKAKKTLYETGAEPRGMYYKATDGQWREVPQ